MELGKLILKEGRVEIASSISTDQSKINTVSLVLEYIPSTASSSSSSSSSSTSQSMISTSSIASSPTERNEGTVTDRVHVERKVEMSTGMDELKAMLKEEKRKINKIERELETLRGSSGPVCPSTTTSNSTTQIHREEKLFDAAPITSNTCSRGISLIPPETRDSTTSYEQLPIQFPNMSIAEDYYTSYHTKIPRHPTYVNAPMIPIFIPIPVYHIPEPYNPHYDPLIYPEGIKYTLKYGGSYKKESIRATEKMLVYFLLGEGYDRLLGINMYLSFSEQAMIKEYDTDHPRAMALARAAYSIYCSDTKNGEKNARRYVPGGGRCITTNSGIIGVLSSFCGTVGLRIKEFGGWIQILDR